MRWISDESYGSWACRGGISTAKVLCMQSLCQLIILLHCCFRVVSLGCKCVDLLTKHKKKLKRILKRICCEIFFASHLKQSRAFWTASESCFRRRAFKCDQTITTANWSFNDVQRIACYSWLCLRTSQNYCILMIFFFVQAVCAWKSSKVLSACASS